jgi:hypothetical protein
MQYRIAEIGHTGTPDKLMGYFVAPIPERPIAGLAQGQEPRIAVDAPG